MAVVAGSEAVKIGGPDPKRSDHQSTRSLICSIVTYSLNYDHRRSCEVEDHSNEPRIRNLFSLCYFCRSSRTNITRESQIPASIPFSTFQQKSRETYFVPLLLKNRQVCVSFRFTSYFGLFLVVFLGHLTLAPASVGRRLSCSRN